MPATNNPYSKKPNASSPASNPYTSAGRKRKEPSFSAAHSESVTIPDNAAVTFSQAFSSLEHTSQYQQELGSVSAAAPIINPRLEQERAEQRALDLQETTNATAAVGAAAADRDHHVLLQPHVLYVSTKQRGNGVLKYIRNVPFAFSKMVPDYIMSTTTCALFLSIKYHQLYPNYIHRRLGELKTDFRLRILLLVVDVEDNMNVLLYLNKLAVTNNLTFILAWSEQEAARYLETYKSLEGKDASSIQKRESNTFQDQNVDFMTACKPVNKTDAATILEHFSNVKAVAAASRDELALCEGLGPIKVQKLFDALHKPFSKKRTIERKRAQQEKERMLEVADTSGVDDHAEENDATQGAD